MLAVGCEHLSALLWGDGHPVGDRMAVDVQERICLQPVQGEVAVILVALQDATSFQKAGYRHAESVQQLVELFDYWRGRAAKPTSA